MSLFEITLTLVLSLFITTCFSQDNAKDKCGIFKSGKFRYLDSEDPTGYIIINGGKQTEHSEKNDYIIESDISWVSDCSYIMTMTRITIPNFPFQPGDTMKVDITKIKGNIIYYTSTVKGVSWNGRFKKIDN
ncbi:MAG: hypothetical protein ABIO79_06645 [Ferruginibacter sp.]